MLEFQVKGTITSIARDSTNFPLLKEIKYSKFNRKRAEPFAANQIKAWNFESPGNGFAYIHGLSCLNVFNLNDNSHPVFIFSWLKWKLRCLIPQISVHLHTEFPKSAQ